MNIVIDLQRLTTSAKSILKQLGAQAFQELALKMGGSCYLCDEAMDLTKDTVATDHVDPKGGNEISNLYIAHSVCNSIKRDLPVDAAKQMIRFKKFCENKQYDVSFDDILARYVSEPKEQTTALRLEGARAHIKFGSSEVSANVMIDPATKVKFFFCDAPIQYIKNDKDVQPRKIDWTHAWHMAQDFEIHPVHEPSACRYVGNIPGTGSLLQFDGQHKTSAQILLGRQHVQMKIYVNPPLPMIKDLIISIQNRIIKKPLLAAVVISKMAAVFRDLWEQEEPKSEYEFVKSRRSDQKPNAKKALLSAIYRTIIDDPENSLDQYVNKQASRRGAYPLSMNNLTNLILKEFVAQEPQEVEVGSPLDFRPAEAKNVLLVLNELTRLLLSSGKWEMSHPAKAIPPREHRKAKRFFSPGAVRCWVPVLKTAINNRLSLDLRPEETSRTFYRILTEEQNTTILLLIKRLVEHPIWTDEKTPGIDNTLNENSWTASHELFTKYSVRLDAGYVVGLPN